jgi:hypothetical protein
MSKISAIGAQLYIGTALSAGTNVTAITNATQAVATAAGLGAAVNDYVLFSYSGWQFNQDRVFRVSNVATNDFTLLGCDTTDTNLFPAGGGAGSTLQRVTTWTSLAADAEDFDLTGGDQQYESVTALADRIESEAPTRRSAMKLSVPFFYDASLAWLSSVRSASNSNAKRPFRIDMASGQKLAGHGFLSFLDAPTKSGGSVLRGKLDFSLGNITSAFAT